MDTSRLETGVLSILTGAPLETVAAELAVPIITLSHAAKTYQAAGQAALDYAVRSSLWRHASIVIDGRHRAEHVGIKYLAPALEELRADQAITGWWYMRKAGHWRIRYLPNPERGEAATRLLAHFLDGLSSDRTIDSWSSGIYEPEIELFGGSAAMDIAHRLFTIDSRHLLRYLSEPMPLGRRELMILLPTVLARAAGLDWFEQGHMWHEVAQGRTVAVDSARVRALSPALRTLLKADIDVADTRLRSVAGLAASYAEAGAALRALMARGNLSRGLRWICSTHVVFAANRLGVTYEQQAQLVATAREVILGSPTSVHLPTAVPNPPIVGKSGQPKIRVIVGAAIFKDGRVLACQRTKPADMAGLWEFPGGRVEPGESEPEALARECREELSIEIKVGIRIGHDALLSNGSAVLRIYTAELVHGLPTLTEHSDLRWLAAEELDAVPWLPADAPTAQALPAILAVDRPTHTDKGLK